MLPFLKNSDVYSVYLKHFFIRYPHWQHVLHKIIICLNTQSLLQHWLVYFNLFYIISIVRLNFVYKSKNWRVTKISIDSGFEPTIFCHLIKCQQTNSWSYQIGFSVTNDNVLTDKEKSAIYFQISSNALYYLFER